MRQRRAIGPFVPIAIAFAAVALATGEAQCQPAAVTRPSAATAPVPDRLSVLKLTWSAMAAVDQANKSGNYSVLRDLGSAGFQTNNNAATLAGIFAGIRNAGIDLADTLVVEPRFDFAPTMAEPGVLRLRGSFPLRPTPIGFDLLYRWEGGWRLHGVAVAPLTAPSR